MLKMIRLSESEVFSQIHVKKDGLHLILQLNISYKCLDYL